MTMSSFGQTDRANVLIFVTNKVENDSWYSDLVTLNRRQQINKLEQRLLSDTIAIRTDSTFTVRRIQPLEIEYYCRPLIIINEDTIGTLTSLQTKKFVIILSDTKFTNVEILNADKAKDQYGKWGLCGMILLTTNDKKVERRIKEMVQ